MLTTTTSRRIKAKTLFRAAGDELEGLIVESGLLALVKVSPSGSRRIVALRYPGEHILPGPHPYAIETLGVEAVVNFKGAETIFEPYRTAQLEQDLRIAYEWLRVSTLDANARVAHFLCETALRQGNPQDHLIDFIFTQQQVGEITGQTSVNVNRVMADLTFMDIIERKGTRQLLIKNWEDLTRLATFTPTYLDPA